MIYKLILNRHLQVALLFLLIQQIIVASSTYFIARLAQSLDKENKLSQKVEMWGKVILSSGVSTWIAYDAENNNVGFISYFTKDSECEITTLYILPQYQSLGLGTTLMNSAIDDISQHNRCISLSLWVLKTNLTAISFYEKIGFKSDGKHSEEPYEDTKIIDIRMVKSL